MIINFQNFPLINCLNLIILSRPFIDIKLLLSILLISLNLSASIIEFFSPGDDLYPVS